MDRITIIFYENINKNHLNDYKDLCLTRNVLNHYKKNTYVYYIAYDDFRKPENIIKNIKKDLENNGYKKFDIL